MQAKAQRLKPKAKRRTPSALGFQLLTCISGIVLALQGSKPFHEKGYV
jgi:hypothetical protein